RARRRRQGHLSRRGAKLPADVPARVRERRGTAPARLRRGRARLVRRPRRRAALMSNVTALRAAVLAAVTLVAAVIALALTHGSPSKPRVPAGAGTWYRALAAPYTPATTAKRGACGAIIRADTIGVAHPVLPCGV